MEFSIRRDETADGGAYRIFATDGTAAGYMTYKTETDGTMVITHTRVEEAFGGQGVGQRLVEAAISDARTEKRKITPVCSYVKRYFEKRPEAVADVARFAT